MTPRRADAPARRARSSRRDRRACRELQRQIYPHALRFALVLVPQSDAAMRITRRAIREVLGDTNRTPPSPHTAVIEAVQRLASSRSRSSDPALSSDERLARAVSELCDGQGMNHRSTARSLGITVDEVDRLHAFAHVAAGVEPATQPRCSGWSLVRRYNDLAPFEATMADRHLALCRECTDAHDARLAARERLRRAVPLGGGGLIAIGGIAGATVVGGAFASVVAVGVIAAASTMSVVDTESAPTSRPAAVIVVDDPLGEPFVVVVDSTADVADEVAVLPPSVPITTAAPQHDVPADLANEHVVAPPASPAETTTDAGIDADPVAAPAPVAVAPVDGTVPAAPVPSTPVADAPVAETDAGAGAAGEVIPVPHLPDAPSSPVVDQVVGIFTTVIVPTQPITAAVDPVIAPLDPVIDPIVTPIEPVTDLVSPFTAPVTPVVDPKFNAIDPVPVVVCSAPSGPWVVCGRDETQLSVGAPAD